MGITPNFWRKKSVFLTGHTGFKGGWLASWLHQMGAHIHGYALPPPTETNFYIETKLQQKLVNSVIGDIRDLSHVIKAISQAKPDIIFHMAAQPLVRQSYIAPVETFSTNVMGTVNVLEAARLSKSVKAIVNITTDKCYENKEWLWTYREIDRLGGHDPYSSSKACAELVSDAYRKSFLSDAYIHLASVRAGNVIGGGDWANDRLIPDFMRALDAGQILKIRSPQAVRPWQHVLEPLSGYLSLAEKLYIDGESFATAWNFGPNDDDAKTVAWVVDKLCSSLPMSRWETQIDMQSHEASLLKLDSNKSKVLLGWSPRWNLETALTETIGWYQAWRNGEDMEEFTSLQIERYSASKQEKSAL